MAVNPIKASEAIKNNYISYLSTVFHLNDPQLQKQFVSLLKEENKFVKGPILEATSVFETGVSINGLINEDVLSDLFKRLGTSFNINRKLYRHQEKAIRKVVTMNRNIVVATGTGSGKTETFLIPIINHLLREIENRTLCPGVRALLLYPMNALANDQMLRIRALLKNFPNITFGRYIGETEKRYSDAREKYMKQFHEEPMKNELISREQMWDTPPNILLTNYAMLEYLLLRPGDSIFFDDINAKHWKYIVVDEAHTYKGAKGIEMAMLLRRLKDRIYSAGSKNLKCIATSATLGKGRDEFARIAEFASQLFGEKFEWHDDEPEKQDIIEAERIPLCLSIDSWGKPDNSLYLKWNSILHDCDGNKLRRLQETGVESGIPQNIIQNATKMCNGDWSIFLYETLKGDKNLHDVQNALQTAPQYLSELAEVVLGKTDKPHEYLTALVDLSNKAKLNGDTPPLLPARYYLFSRAVEGVYLRLRPEKHLYVERYKTVKYKDVEYPVNEIAACSQCGAIYLVGVVTHNSNGKKLSQGSDIYTNDYFLLNLKKSHLTEIDEDEQIGLDESAIDNSTDEEYILCGVCNSIDRTGSVDKLCDCGEDNYCTLIKVSKGKDGRVYKCPACGKCSPSGIVWRFLTGTEASASVLCNALYQQIESRPVKTEPQENHEDEWEFISEYELTNDVENKDKYENRKLLVFSDSRQDAAFFAPYFNRTYNQILRRCLIIQTLIEHRHDVLKNKWRLQDLVEPIRKNALEAGYFSGMSMQQTKSEVWKWLMYELIALDRRNSLEGLGLLGFELTKPEGWCFPKQLIQGKWQLSIEEVWTLYRILLDSLRVKGAVVFPDHVSPTNEFFQPRNKEFYFRAEGADRKKGIFSWNTNASLNSRLDYLIRLSDRLKTGITEGECISVLRVIYQSMIGNSYPAARWKNHIRDLSIKGEGVLYRLNNNMWELRPALLDDSIKWFRCNRCNMITMNNIRNVCPNYRCKGSLVPCNPLIDNRNNHYFNLYTNSKPFKMICEEHTAQLTSEAASNLQNRFVEGEVNVLSCSTTFEMGVDVGELEAVFMRNVPPSSANYIQRAGRAGRRADSTAFVLTFAQRRSHDIAHYNNPELMVSGEISAPYFKVENVKILRRHIFSTAFAYFWKENNDYFGKVGNFFQNKNGYGIDRFKAFVDSKPAGLYNSIKTIIPQNMWKTLGVESWEWTDYLFNDSFGVLHNAHCEIIDDLSSLEELRAKLYERRRSLGHVDRLIRTILEKDLIGYLSNRNVLPKYGFPVDVVELELGHHGEEAKRLQLERDLRIAISEYAPGGQVIAGGKLWESRYIKRLTRMEWDSYKYGICDLCGNYSRVRAEFSDSFNKTCSVCGNTFGRNSGVFIIPSFGFLTGMEAPGNPRENKPDRTYSTRVYYSGEADEEDSYSIYFASETIMVTPAVNAKMAVINNGKSRGFSICRFCGYTVLTGSKIRKPHLGPRGQECNGTLHSRLSLGHEFETDILKIKFVNTFVRDGGFWLSLLYAIIEGACLGLGIERNDLDGCLYPIDGSFSRYLLIIYDDVPGGAGHVQRIAQKENITIALKTALNKMISCECGGEETGTSCYGCLRNYRNQFCHDLLDRGLVIKFLQKVLGK